MNTSAFSTLVLGPKASTAAANDSRNSCELGLCDRERGEAEPRQNSRPNSKQETNRPRHRRCDPLNLVVIGEFDTVLHGLGALPDETVTIKPHSSGLMSKRLLARQRIPLFAGQLPFMFDGRSQDFSLQKTTHDQPAVPSAARPIAAAFHMDEAGLDRPDQPRHRRVCLHEDMEPDHARDRSQCRCSTQGYVPDDPREAARVSHRRFRRIPACKPAW